MAERPRIDWYGAEYLYVQVADDVIRRIESGELRPGERLPSECALASEYRVSDRTVRRALIDLRTRGAIRTVRRKGSYVTWRS